MGGQLLMKIFDQEMAPLKCVPDTEEASLLLRTLAPRLEAVQDELEAKLDQEPEVKEMVQKCEQNCTCEYLDDLLREHLVSLSPEVRRTLDQKKKQKDLGTCLNYLQGTFCNSDLYKALDQEKKDFSYDEGPR